MKHLYYFGTAIDRAGHYVWEITDEMRGRSLDAYYALVFDPEAMPIRKKRGTGGKAMPLGEVHFYSLPGHSIMAIEGSCGDDRPGCKSVFWVTDNLDYHQLKQVLLSNKCVARIFEKMPFEVHWRPE